MKVTLRIDDIWPEGISVNQAADSLDMNPRSLAALKRGTEKGSWATLVKVQRWLKEQGEEFTLEQLLEVEED